MSAKDVICGYMPEHLKIILRSQDFSKISEIHMRAGKPLIINQPREIFLSPQGKPVDCSSAYTVTQKDISDALALLSDFSLYVLEEELCGGFLTLPGGHRVGLTGKAVMENGRVKTMKNINGFNIRVSREIKGCADQILPHIVSPSLHHTMIISPPGCGKTTLLRDLVRQLSDGKYPSRQGYTVGLVDERGEIAGCYRGIPQNDVGVRTDVLDSYPKSIGMTMLLRAMSPRVIAVDELGSRADTASVEEIINAGVCIICTTHGADINEVKLKPGLRDIFYIFERFTVLRGLGTIAGIFDRAGRRVG
ncbi:MAG: stage III sporulation protein AA [Clostridiales bacterium]|jgi:stage III sporulation protein AA|nr:stage III sporulation protein AA [Clostridiales bacterium]